MADSLNLQKPREDMQKKNMRCIVSLCVDLKNKLDLLQCTHAEDLSELAAMKNTPFVKVYFACLQDQLNTDFLDL